MSTCFSNPLYSVVKSHSFLCLSPISLLQLLCKIQLYEYNTIYSNTFPQIGIWAISRFLPLWTVLLWTLFYIPFCSSSKEPSWLLSFLHCFIWILELLTTAEIRKQQPRCLWIDKWIKKMCVCMYIYTTHTHNGILFRYIKRKSCHL